MQSKQQRIQKNNEKQLFQKPEETATFINLQQLLFHNIFWSRDTSKKNHP